MRGPSESCLWSSSIWVFLLGTTIAQDAVFVVGQKWQIVLSAVPNLSSPPLVPSDAEVWDIDLWDSDNSTIASLKAAGKTVICYFSAGTSEDWRPDYAQFATGDKGAALPDWKGENWLRLESANVRAIMKARIEMAKSKGCDAIDPDNVDGYSNTNGLGLTTHDSIDYMNFLVTTAASYDLKTGLKNALQILPDVTSIVDFAVNEQCAQYSECASYTNFVAAGKPVFHIEYPSKAPNVAVADRAGACENLGVNGLSTVLKELDLGGWVEYCDGSMATTPTRSGGGTNPFTTRPVPTSRPPHPSSTSTRLSTTTTTTTSRPPRPTSTSSRPSIPSATPSGGGGSGCVAKHWDQCGGTNWKGCTVCESGYTCKPQSPPWYYQCL